MTSKTKLLMYPAKKQERRKEERKKRKNERIHNILIYREIWTKSIVVRQDLVPIFFDLLMMNDEVNLHIPFSSLIICLLSLISLSFFPFLFFVINNLLDDQQGTMVHNRLRH